MIISKGVLLPCLCEDGDFTPQFASSFMNTVVVKVMIDTMTIGPLMLVCMQLLIIHKNNILNLLYRTLNCDPGTNAIFQNLFLRFSGRAVTSSQLRITPPLLLPSLVSQVMLTTAGFTGSLGAT